MANYIRRQTCQSSDDEDEIVDTYEELSVERDPVDIGYSRSPTLCLLFNSFFSCVYGYSIYYHNYDLRGSLFNKMLDEELQQFGLFKFLTYNSLILQFVSMLLSLLSHVSSRYFRYIRDTVFLCLSFPVGCHVVSTFWVVYYTQGRDTIYPISIEPYYPSWLNHVTHTILLPVNIAQAYITHHKPQKNGSLISIGFIIVYFLFILYIRFTAGMFPYPYMNDMNKISLLIYIGCMFFCSFGFYQIGCTLSEMFYSKRMGNKID